MKEKGIQQQIMDLTGLNGEMLQEFLERVDNFVLDYSQELEDRGYKPQSMLGLSWALTDASERIVVSCQDYVKEAGIIFDT